MLEKFGRNNFDILRIILAIVVYFYHVGVLVDIEILKSLPGENAVQCFFVISGFLITRSYLKNRDISTYCKSRFLRVYPLYVMVVVIVFIFGSYITDRTVFEYYKEGINYLLYNLLFLNFLQPELPGVFQNLSIKAVNGSLWTIKIEVMFYIFVPIIYGFINSKKIAKNVTAFFFMLSVFSVLLLEKLIDIYGMPESLNNQLPSQLCFFMVGAYFNFINFKQLKTVTLTIVLGFLYTIRNELIFIQPLLVGLTVYIMAFRFPIIEVSKRLGDLSYGIYIWHFPVIQTFNHFGYYGSKLEGVISSTVIVFLLSYISWHGVEKRILSKASK